MLDGAITGVGLLNLGDGVGKRHLRLGHPSGLSLGFREILLLRDGLCVSDLAGLVIDDDLRVLAILHRVDRQLQLTVLDLKLSGYRLALCFGCFQAVSQ